MSTMYRSCTIDVAIMFACCAHLLELVSSYAIGHGSDTKLTRNRRQTIMCRYIIDPKNGMTDAFANKPVPSTIPHNRSCAWWCLVNAMCTGVVEGPTECRYSTSHSVALSRQTGKIVYRIASRCPPGYPCYSGKCKDGSTCSRTSLNESSPGRKCMCADDWTAWYCEVAITYTNTTITTTAASTTTTISITTTTTTTIKAITSSTTVAGGRLSTTTKVSIAVAAAGVVVVFGCLIAVVTGIAAATRRAAAKDIHGIVRTVKDDDTKEDEEEEDEEDDEEDETNMERKTLPRLSK
ncbi:hypothetical protein LSAT2_016387 [Lamellibrachia satsuma]|nr:hypothetical protein LSAT2_016387 [Lamellibrachia satsuma]